MPRAAPLAGIDPILGYKTVGRASRATIGEPWVVLYIMSQHVTNVPRAVKYALHTENATTALKDIISMNIRVALTTAQRALRRLPVQLV